MKIEKIVNYICNKIELFIILGIFFIGLLSLLSVNPLLFLIIGGFSYVIVMIGIIFCSLHLSSKKYREDIPYKTYYQVKKGDEIIKEIENEREAHNYMIDSFEDDLILLKVNVFREKPEDRIEYEKIDMSKVVNDYLEEYYIMCEGINELL